jgi:hypothetical protein
MLLLTSKKYQAPVFDNEKYNKVTNDSTIEQENEEEWIATNHK